MRSVSPRPEHLVGGQRLPRLPSARLSSSMTLLANGGLLVVGGATCGPSGFRSLDEVLLLKHPGTDATWTKLCPMPFRIHSALVVAIGQDTYAIGGCTDRQEGNGVRTNMLVMRGGCAGHHHDDADLCWEPWGTLPGRLVGMETVVFRAEEARPSDPSAS
ncbi:hypothetical protein HPB52_023036 [Rhipicephalus sanguineus]|uniref:Uncharacterized protein n=1 Tax=Rhipicephalus sanguineus TaxID=34632 RepID=A0A9D4PH90_RHISA|nr:hypothetical protein HPB52_023036 [Rhipicephalus sanguineus]